MKFSYIPPVDDFCLSHVKSRCLCRCCSTGFSLKNIGPAVPHDKAPAMMVLRLNVLFEFAGDFSQTRVMSDMSRFAGYHRDRKGDERELLHFAATIFAADATSLAVFRPMVRQSPGVKPFGDLRQDLFHGFQG